MINKKFDIDEEYHDYTKYNYYFSGIKFMRFFDSLPTNQSRLLTFRCPYYKTRTDVRHYVTIAWKSKDPSLGEGVSLLSENVEYVGKPLALFPNAISASYKKDLFPLGTLYATCSCMPERNGKICYISTEVTDGNYVGGGAPDETSKIRKRLEDDFKVTNRLLVQLYDVLEDLQKDQRKNQKELKKIFSEYQNTVVQEKEKVENRIHKISKLLVKLPDYFEERFLGLREYLDTGNFDNMKIFKNLMLEVEALEEELQETKETQISEEFIAQIDKPIPKITRIEVAKNKKPEKQEEPKKAEEQEKKEEKEEYFDLFEAQSSFTPTVLEQETPKPKTVIPKDAFSVTQILNKSALARQIKDHPNSQDLDKIFFMDDQMPNSKKEKEASKKEEK